LLLSYLPQVIVTKQSELDQSTAELRTLKVQLETTTAQKTEAEEQVKAEAKKSSDLNGLLGTFRDKLKTEREQGSALTQEKSAIVAEVESLKGAQEVVEKQLRRSSVTLDEKTALVAALSDDINQAKERHSSVLATMESEIKSMKLASDNASTAAARQLESSQKAEAKARDTIAQLTGSAVTAAADLSKLRSEMPVLQSSLDKKVAELAEMKSSYTVETANLKQSLAVKEEAVSKLQKQLSESENKLSLLRKDSEDVKKKNESEISALQCKLKAQIDESMKMKQATEEGVAGSDKEMKILSKKIEVLENIRKTLAADKESLILKNNETQQQQNKEKEVLNSKINSMKSALEVLNGSMKSENESRAAELLESKNKIEKLNNEIRELRAATVSTASSLTDQITALQTKNAEVIEKHEQYKAEREKEVVILKKELVEKVTLLKEETNVILVEKKKEEEQLVRKLDDTSKALVVLKKQAATLTTENESKSHFSLLCLMHRQKKSVFID
jgi:DNA repair exonuclease SbcCD ATPase subunit